MRLPLAAATLLALAVFSWHGARVAAHITEVSPFTFHEDVRPILQRRCTQCHVEGGVAPTALVRYQDARSQSWPIRQALMSGRMPPWHAQPGAVALKEEQALTARELDVLMTWAAGGTPEGRRRARIAESPAAGPMLAPDVTMAMPAAFVLAQGVQEADHEVVFAAEGLRGKWIRAVNVLPDARAIVRRAQISIRSGADEQVIGLWLPGDEPQMLEANGAFLMPHDGTLVLRLHYQRPRPADAAAVLDRSSVGVYLARAPAAQIRSLTIVSARQLVTRPMRAVAIRPIAGSVDATMRIVAISRDGVRTSLLRFNLRPEWPRRYVFAAPVVLQPRSQIDVSVVPARNDLWHTLTSPAARAASPGIFFRGALEVVE